MALESLLKQVGLSDKEAQLYVYLLETGPSSVRSLASTSGINRGTVYDVLKSLKKRGLLSYYHKSTHQYFVAENPEKLVDFIEQETIALNRAKKDLKDLIPDLRSMGRFSSEKPAVKYYEGTVGVKTILQDVLSTMSKATKKEYYAYSAADVRQHLYKDFPHFAKNRVKKKIRVKVIAIGSGGMLWGLDERKWLTKAESSPAYIILYDDKVATISLDANNKLHGILITDKGIAATQKIIFEQLYKTLK